MWLVCVCGIRLVNVLSDIVSVLVLIVRCGLCMFIM